MQQYFAKNKNLELEKSDLHHIKNVMRMKVNDKIKVVFNDDIYTCKLTSLDDVKFEVIDIKTKERPKVKVTVAFSLIKEQKLDYLLQKSTEIGIDSFIPLKTKRSVVKIDRKKDRWDKICKEAAEQSFRNYIPSIDQIRTVKDLINMDFDLKLLCSLNKNTKNIKKVIQKNNKCDRILLVVGPEGGFDPSEEQLLEENGFVSVSLGANVLRAETAPVVALSMINYEFMR